MSHSDKASKRRSWISLARKDRSKDRDQPTDVTYEEWAAAGNGAPADGQLSRTVSSTSGAVSTPRGSSTRFVRTDSVQSYDSFNSLDSAGIDQPPFNPRRSYSDTFDSDRSSQQVQSPGSHSLERIASAPPENVRRDAGSDFASPTSRTPTTGSTSAFNKYSLTSILGLNREKPEEQERGRPTSKKEPSSRKSSVGKEESDRSKSRGRSSSPFLFRSRMRNRRDSSPSSVVEALAYDGDSDNESVSAPRLRPRNAFSTRDGDDSSESGSDDSEESWSETEGIDEITAQHTEANAAIVDQAEVTEVAEPDPLGEGINVVVPSEPYFPTTLQGTGARAPRRRKSTKVVVTEKDLLPMTTGRPVFARDRCTITLVHGDPASVVRATGKTPKTYIVASDLSEESRYAVEWGVGTVLRDGDSMLIVHINETDAKLDPPEGATVDRIAKLRSQQDRQTLAYLLVRQATGLLQRTKLHVTVICQAWHAKNARHMLLDLIDYKNPTMVIVGSRGLTRLKGIILGSTSHYLIQKSSVPVMVARRRLKRPAKKNAHLAPHRARVSLAEAAIEKMGPGKIDKDVEVMREEVHREDAAREAVDLRLAGTDRGLAESDSDPE